MHVAPWIVVDCWQYAPDVVPDMPKMMPQTCPRNDPRWCPRWSTRHAPDDAPDMPQMMPQTCPYNTSRRFTFVGGLWLLSCCWLHYQYFIFVWKLAHLCVKVSLKTQWFSQGPPNLLRFWLKCTTVYSANPSRLANTVNHCNAMHWKVLKGTVNY